MPITESPDHYNFTGASPSREYERLNRNKQLDPMNEPKSETPRTDKIESEYFVSSEHADVRAVGAFEKVRTLERELNEANAVINQLPDGAIETLQKWFTAKTERDAWRACANRLAEFVSTISKQSPEKPDYWSSCGQCDRNIDEAQITLAEFNKLKGGQ